MRAKLMLLIKDLFCDKKCLTIEKLFYDFFKFFTGFKTGNVARWNFIDLSRFGIAAGFGFSILVPASH